MGVSAEKIASQNDPFIFMTLFWIVAVTLKLVDALSKLAIMFGPPTPTNEGLTHNRIL